LEGTEGSRRSRRSKVTNEKGMSAGAVTSPVEFYRLQSLEPLRLFGGARALYGLNVSGDCIWMNTIVVQEKGGEEDRTIGRFSFVGPRPSWATEIRLEIRVVLYDPDKPEQELSDAMFECTVTSAPDGRLRITPADHRHRLRRGRS
jgi:hypothetical protein